MSQSSLRRNPSIPSMYQEEYFVDSSPDTRYATKRFENNPVTWIVSVDDPISKQNQPLLEYGCYWSDYNIFSFDGTHYLIEFSRNVQNVCLIELFKEWAGSCYDNSIWILNLITSSFHRPWSSSLYVGSLVQHTYSWVAWIQVSIAFWEHLFNFLWNIEQQDISIFP